MIHFEGLRFRAITSHMSYSDFQAGCRKGGVGKMEGGGGGGKGVVGKVYVWAGGGGGRQRGSSGLFSRLNSYYCIVSIEK